MLSFSKILLYIVLYVIVTLTMSQNIKISKNVDSVTSYKLEISYNQLSVTV